MVRDTGGRVRGLAPPWSSRSTANTATEERLLATIRTWLLRRLARRFHIGEDILAHLSTFQRLGEQFEIEAPSEMLPVGARTLVRALRSRAAPQIRPDWLWPYWMDRQLDPESEAFVPRGHLAVLTNLTHRNWTAVGNLWSPWEAIVDPRGLVTPWYDGWSIDWWVRVDGAWQFPSRHPHVEQSLHGGVPVVETRLHADAGDVVARAYGQVVDELPGGEAVVVEVSNLTGGNVEVAFALRPYNPEGLAVLSDIRLRGLAVSLQHDELALVLPRTPASLDLSTFEDGDVANRLVAGLAGGARDAAVHDPAGLAQAAFVYDLPADESLRVAAPLLPGEEQRRRKRSLRPRSGPLRPTSAVQLRSSDHVATSWRAPLARGMQVELPEGDIQAAVDANRAFQLLLHDPGSITPGPFTYHRFWFRDAAYQTVALDRWGLHQEAADVLRSFPGRQRADGFFYSQWREWDANGAAIWAVAEHHRLSGDDQLLAELAPSVARGARWIERKRRHRDHGDPALRGLLPAGVSAEHLGPFDYYYWDDFWALRGLRDAAYVGYQVGDLTSAAAAEESFASLRADVLASLERSVARIGRRAIPAGPRRGVDAGMIGSLAAAVPLQVLDVDDPLVAGTADVIRERFCHGDAFFQGISHTGFGTYLTLQLAAVELEAGDPRAWSRFRWLLDAATQTWTWPEAIHPRIDGGCMGDGHHGWASADVLSFVRDVLVRDGRDGTVALVGFLPDSWVGQPLAVRDAPTHRGRVSYELVWDEDRPTLRWEVERDDVTLTAPGLDPTWRTTDRQGSATFAAQRG